MPCGNPIPTLGVLTFWRPATAGVPNLTTRMVNLMGMVHHTGPPEVEMKPSCAWRPWGSKIFFMTPVACQYQSKAENEAGQNDSSLLATCFSMHRVWVLQSVESKYSRV